MILAAATTLLLGGCAGGDAAASSGASAGCVKAFEDATKLEGVSDTHEALFPVFDACTTLDEFAAVAADHPDLLAYVDPETYARNGCQYRPEVADSTLCASAAALDEEADEAEEAEG
ncbi:hypothetical protein DNL40_14775 [Xylanimonas oleitrophica]|uniref:Uncharacterized protein n=1 Tax=Xylanimonas oleitrophica TaxID=2607479 RepID=A0A2W5WLJ6_9MICO|nr:hypothetical protein DNL40_14775 [Xylanimonas oleitrophica]